MLLKYILFNLIIVISLFGKSNFEAITTGSTTGTYIQLGKDLSTIFQKYKAELKVLSSEGSIDNLNALSGKNEKKGAKWAIVQSDALVYYKFLHFKDTKEEITDKIKTILPLYDEHIHIFTKKGKKISLKKGSILKVGVTSKESGSNVTANIIEKAYRVNFQYRYVNFEKALKYLQEDKLDIVISVISFPSKNFKKLKNVDLVQLPKNKIMDKRYIRTKFTKNRYSWLTKDILGYKVPSILVTNRVEKKYNQTVGIFLKIILNNYQALTKYGHPIWKEAYRNKTLKVENMHPVAYRILHK